MKNCINCGTQLEDTAMFCANCGTKQPDSKPAAPVTQTTPAAQPTPVKTKKGGKRVVFAFITIIIAIVMFVAGLGGGIGIGLLIVGKEKSPEPVLTTEFPIIESTEDISVNAGTVVTPTDAPIELTTEAPTEKPQTTTPEPVYLLAEGYYFPASANGDLNLDNYIKVDEKLVSIQLNLMEAVIMAEATYTVEDNKIILDELLWTNTTVCDEGVILEVYGDCIYVYNFESNFALQGWMCPQDYLDGNGFYK